MAQKKIGIYGKLESTANSKVENLYVIVNKKSVVFIVKHLLKNEYIAIEHFEQTDEQAEWNPLFAYLQNNSTLIQNYYKNIYFVNNSARLILKQKNNNDDLLLAASELQLIHGNISEEEIYTTSIGEKHFLVYGVSDKVSSLLTRFFPSGKWQHYASFFLQNVHENEVQVRLFEDYFMLYIIENGQTKLLNYFPLTQEDQNVYTLLNSCINAGVDTNTITLKVWGYIQEKHAFIQKVSPYFAAAQLVALEPKSMCVELNKFGLPNSYSSYFIF